MIPSDSALVTAYKKTKSTVDRIGANPQEFERFEKNLSDPIPTERRPQVVHRLLTLRKRGLLPRLHRPK